MHHHRIRNKVSLKRLKTKRTIITGLELHQSSIKTQIANIQFSDFTEDHSLMAPNSTIWLMKAI